MRVISLTLLVLLNLGCTPTEADLHDHETDDVSGEHGGRLLQHEDTSLELLIDTMTGVPEFRAWVRQDGARIPPEEVELTLTLQRLGEAEEVLGFQPVGEVLISESAVPEPHSFDVTVDLRIAGARYRWDYESVEGRTQITPAMAEKFGLVTAAAGAALIRETVEVFGTIQADPARNWMVQARFPGIVRSVAVQPGDRVQAGAELAQIESDESLKPYRLAAPADGVLIERMANTGEHTGDRTLFRIVDHRQVWAMFSVFPVHRSKVRIGQVVTVRSVAGDGLAEGRIDWIGLEADQDQSVPIRVVLENPAGELLPGMRITGSIGVLEHAVPLAVRRSALQRFREFSVVYRQVGEFYEVRMLKLGRQDEEWVEVLDGLRVGDVYVTENSYLVKADIDKDSAAHEH